MLGKTFNILQNQMTNEAARPNIFTFDPSWKLLTARSSQSVVWLYGERFYWKRSCFFIFLLEYLGSCLLLIAQSSTSLQPDGPQPTVMRYLQIFLCLRQRAYIQSARSCLSKSAFPLIFWQSHRLSTIITSMSITMPFLQMPSHNEHFVQLVYQITSNNQPHGNHNKLHLTPNFLENKKLWKLKKSAFDLPLCTDARRMQLLMQWNHNFC